MHRSRSQIYALENTTYRAYRMKFVAIKMHLLRGTKTSVGIAILSIFTDFRSATSGKFAHFDRHTVNNEIFLKLIKTSGYFHSQIVDIVSQSTFTAIINTSLYPAFYRSRLCVVRDFKALHFPFSS